MQELEVTCRTRGNFCAEIGLPVAKLPPKDVGRIPKIPVDG